MTADCSLSPSYWLWPRDGIADASRGSCALPVTQWIDLELDAIAAHRLNPPRAARALAHLSTGMYLAAIVGDHAADDAVAGAASAVLVYLHPDEVVRVEALADQIADRDSEAFRRGRLIGRLLIARAERDGADANWTGAPPEDRGFWIPTSPSERVSAARAAGRNLPYLES